MRNGQNTQLGGGQLIPYETDADQPSPTIRANPAGMARLRHPGRTYGTTTTTTEEPAPTVALGHNAAAWAWERPATTVMGDSRIFQPGHHGKPGAQSENAIPVTTEELATLQDFPDSYPFQGSKTARQRQIGNAIPRKLAYAILTQLVPATTSRPGHTQARHDAGE